MTKTPQQLYQERERRVTDAIACRNRTGSRCSLFLDPLLLSTEVSR